MKKEQNQKLELEIQEVQGKNLFDMSLNKIRSSINKGISPEHFKTQMMDLNDLYLCHKNVFQTNQEVFKL